MKKLQKFHYILIIINSLLLAGFISFYLSKANYEFVVYVGIIALLAILVVYSHVKYINYTKATLIGLTIWSAMHLSGGGVSVQGGRLYELMLIPMSDKLPIFRYDQLAHIVGFFVATLVAYCLIRKFTGHKIPNTISFAIVVIMAGLGFGALNEILEFIVSYNVPNTGVGGYINNSLDLCSDLIGAFLGWVYVSRRYLRD